VADRIIGQATNLTTVSAGGGGNVRVTYAPWELDWEWFDTIAIGHWLANVTTATSDDIVAKGGSEHLGYWFEISTAFPSANWNSGNRIAPQRQAAILQYATFAAALAAMANDDYFLVWYRNAANVRYWDQYCNFDNHGGSIWGMLSRKQIFFATASPTAQSSVYYRFNLLGMAVTAVCKNLTFASAVAGVAFSPTAGQEGQGVSVERCRGLNSYCASFTVAAAAKAGCRVVNCEAILDNGNNGFNQNAQVPIYFCTAFMCTAGYNIAAPAQNLLAVECGSDAGFNGATNSIGTSLVNQFQPHATNLLAQDPRTQIRLLYDLARPGNKAFIPDVRIHWDSVCRGRGVAIAGITRDADGVLRPDPPSVGAYEPVPVGYSPAGDLVMPTLLLPAMSA